MFDILFFLNSLLGVFLKFMMLYEEIKQGMLWVSKSENSLYKSLMTLITICYPGYH